MSISVEFSDIKGSAEEVKEEDEAETLDEMDEKPLSTQLEEEEGKEVEVEATVKSLTSSIKGLLVIVSTGKGELGQEEEEGETREEEEGETNKEEEEEVD